mmetsp:Transcript_63008/g.146731  ORF Transcript_63008/g.146731 Transcript_63008/m.146731 type:complete len:205 (-) Transcript_63008:178-792(-)
MCSPPSSILRSACTSTSRHRKRPSDRVVTSKERPLCSHGRSSGTSSGGRCHALSSLASSALRASRRDDSSFKRHSSCSMRTTAFSATNLAPAAALSQFEMASVTLFGGSADPHLVRTAAPSTCACICASSTLRVPTSSPITGRLSNAPSSTRTRSASCLTSCELAGDSAATAGLSSPRPASSAGSRPTELLEGEALTDPPVAKL